MSKKHAKKTTQIKKNPKKTPPKKDKEHEFNKELDATNEKTAKEKIYAHFGGKNKIKRKDIMIKEIKESK